MVLNVVLTVKWGSLHFVCYSTWLIVFPFNLGWDLACFPCFLVQIQNRIPFFWLVFETVVITGNIFLFVFVISSFFI